MKICVVLFIAFFTATSLCAANYQECENAPPAPSQPSPPPKLGTYLKDDIYALVVGIVQNLAPYILRLAPANSVQSIAAIASALKSLPTPTVQTVIAKLLSLSNADGTWILNKLPQPILMAPVDVDNLLSSLVASLPPGTKSITFATCISLVGGYFVLFATYFYVNLLNYYS